MFVLVSSGGRQPDGGYDAPFAVGCTLLAGTDLHGTVARRNACKPWMDGRLRDWGGMLGYLLREHADLAQRSAALEQSALLWADWLRAGRGTRKTGGLRRGDD